MIAIVTNDVHVMCMICLLQIDETLSEPIAARLNLLGVRLNSCQRCMMSLNAVTANTESPTRH